MKNANYWKKLDKNNVQCELCPHNCLIEAGKSGICRVRRNFSGSLFSLNYAKPAAIHVDPVEKKPLFHFKPGSAVFSIGTIGCNLGCMHCQNWGISRANPETTDSEEIKPDQIVEMAEESGCSAIAHTYNEPTIFYEYMYDIAKAAKKKGISNIIVSNGYINQDPLRELCNVIDAANIDLKAFTEEFYMKICKGSLEPVLDSLKILKQQEVWLEITNLIIPTLNDNMHEIEEMCKWISEELGKEVPLHFSRFHPDFKLTNKPVTPIKTLENAKKTADKYLNFVYIGNIMTDEHENTYCPRCKKLLINRVGYQIMVQNIKNGSCPYCSQKIPGIWQ